MQGHNRPPAHLPAQQRHLGRREAVAARHQRVKLLLQGPGVGGGHGGFGGQHLPHQGPDFRLLRGLLSCLAYWSN